MINRFWKSLPTVMCCKIWLTVNKRIFKDQSTRVRKILSKTWGPTSEILNMIGTTTMDYNTLHREERDWISKATIKNNGKKSLMKIHTTQDWKERLNEGEFIIWKEN